MKFSLLLLLLPLHSFAQYNRGGSYMGPTMQQNQLSQRQFNDRMIRNQQEYQQRWLDRHHGRSYSSVPQNYKTQAQAQAEQQKREKEANEALARLTQQQQQQRQAHPAQDAQAAAAQQRADDKQLNQLAVKNYRDVFLPWQVATALEAQQFPYRDQRTIQALNDNLTSELWWNKQDKAQVASKVKAYSDSLTTLTTNLLGFNLASPPASPAPFSPGTLDAMLSKDTFDQNVAAQLIKEAALTERLQASDQLLKAVQDFSALATTEAASPAATQADVKKMMHDVRASLRTLESALARYQGRINSANDIFTVEKAFRKSTSAYLGKSGK